MPDYAINQHQYVEPYPVVLLHDNSIDKQRERMRQLAVLCIDMYTASRQGGSPIPQEMVN